MIYEVNLFIAYTPQRIPGDKSFAFCIIPAYLLVLPWRNISARPNAYYRVYIRPRSSVLMAWMHD